MEIEKLWEIYDKLVENHNFKKDPDALEIVFHIGQPYWLSKVYSWSQKRVFFELLNLVKKNYNDDALEIGCGGGRWIKELIKKGYNVTGIDLQKGLIEFLKKRFPQGNFHSVSLFDFKTTKKFNLILSITVLQHIPYEKQIIAINKIRELCDDKNCSVIIIENIKDKSKHVFSNSIEEWINKFERNNFRCYKVIPVLFLPITIKYENLKKTIFKKLNRERTDDIYTIINNKHKGGKIKKFLKQIDFYLKWYMGIFDSILEDIFLKRDNILTSTHCGFLFKPI